MWLRLARILGDASFTHQGLGQEAGPSTQAGGPAEADEPVAELPGPEGAQGQVGQQTSVLLTESNSKFRKRDH